MFEHEEGVGPRGNLPAELDVERGRPVKHGVHARRGAHVPGAQIVIKSGGPAEHLAEVGDAAHVPGRQVLVERRVEEGPVHVHHRRHVPVGKAEDRRQRGRPEGLPQRRDGRHVPRAERRGQRRAHEHVGQVGDGARPPPPDVGRWVAPEIRGEVVAQRGVVPARAEVPPQEGMGDRAGARKELKQRREGTGTAAPSQTLAPGGVRPDQSVVAGRNMQQDFVVARSVPLRVADDHFTVVSGLWNGGPQVHLAVQLGKYFVVQHFPQLGIPAGAILLQHVTPLPHT
mmetsp:Transcript_28533/g.57038  ORF Transcript_28533/g.57038 Transcript_28533/m.57038 type:complete len:285 (+) Transcript_28533:195-1049(+)